MPYDDPILVLGADGVGTKLKIAIDRNCNSTIGVDLVAMCVNDILCNGADPVSFLDYFACGKLDVDVARNVIAGIGDACKESRCSLLGGETAEMPGMYEAGDYDLAGFALGIAEHNLMLPRCHDIEDGDILIGLPSAGLHSNGFSLMHKIMEYFDLKWTDVAPFSANRQTYSEEFLTPTKIYVSALQSLGSRRCLVKGIAHITGGGLIENIPRTLAENHHVVLDATKFNIPSVYGWIAEMINISEYELLRTFNCGIGLVLIVSPAAQLEVSSALVGYGASVIGHVSSSTGRPKTSSQRVTVENFSSQLSRVQRCLSVSRKRVGVLISGTGSNLQALIDATRDTNAGLFCDVVCVVANKEDAYGLKRAEQAKIPHKFIDHRAYKTREEFDEEVSRELEHHRVDIVCLAGFMRILSATFVKKWTGRMLNIHPSLLPKYKGTNAQRQALEAGDTVSGCSVHFVDENVDTGAVVVQEFVPISVGRDTVETLTQKIHRAEHVAFPKALRLLATGAVHLDSTTGKVHWN